MWSITRLSHTSMSKWFCTQENHIRLLHSILVAAYKISKYDDRHHIRLLWRKTHREWGEIERMFDESTWFNIYTYFNQYLRFCLYFIGMHSSCIFCLLLFRLLHLLLFRFNLRLDSLHIDVVVDVVVALFNFLGQFCSFSSCEALFYCILFSFFVLLMHFHPTFCAACCICRK